MKEPARVVSEQFDVDVRVDDWIELDGEENQRTGEIVIHEIKEDIDVLVLQRPVKKYVTALIKQAKEQGIAVVVDIDDHFHALHPQNRAARSLSPENNPLENIDWVLEATKEADLVTASTPSLAAFYGGSERGVVIPNYVPASIEQYKVSNHSPLRLGWSGTIQTHPTDLQVTGGGVGTAIKRNNAEFFVVGDGRNVSVALGLDGRLPVKDSGWVALDDYYETLAKNIDVGVVPLDAIEFNEAKSWLKGIELAALGIPFVASPTSEYLKLAELGVGTIAENPAQWYKKLNTWINNPRKRVSDGNRYRDTVLSTLTYEQNAHRWLAAWQQAIENRKADS